MPKVASKLSEWFVASKTYPGANCLLYTDFTTYFCWNRSSKEWTPRACFKAQFSRRVQTDARQTDDSKDSEDGQKP